MFFYGMSVMVFIRRSKKVCFILPYGDFEEFLGVDGERGFQILC